MNSPSFEIQLTSITPLNLKHLQLRASEFNGIELTKDLFLEKLRERLTTADIEMVKQDVEPFIIDRRELDIWSNDYFLQLSDMIRFEE